MIGAVDKDGSGYSRQDSSRRDVEERRDDEKKIDVEV